MGIFEVILCAVVEVKGNDCENWHRFAQIMLK